MHYHRLEDKIIQIEKIQRLHVNRPTLDENSKEESDIRHSTNEITEVYIFFMFSPVIKITSQAISTKRPHIFFSYLSTVIE